MGLIEPLVVGSGTPVTVVAHGLGASIAETRPLLSGVGGTKVFPTARGHGANADPAGDYPLLGRDLEQVADQHAATQALGVSMGAGALLALMSRHPERFARVVLFLPPALDRPRPDAVVRRGAMLADLVAGGDADALRRAVLDELPDDLRATSAAAAYARARSDFLLASPGVAAVLRRVPTLLPVADAKLLRAVRAPVLLLAQEGDPLHPADVARELAGLLPASELVIFDRPGVLFRERSRVRALVRDFLS